MDTRAVRPDHPVANVLEGAGAMAIFFGLIGLFATFASWLDFGEWLAVLNWFGAGSALLIVVGVALGWIGYDWNRRTLARWENE